ncbi:MAG TPA: hypothetical protein GXX75_07845 [Clostridiales bacterium]|nr:hypothetical protein [Clostridiales bacterium]
MNKEINIDLRRCLKAILKKWWLIIIVGGVCFGAAYLITLNNLKQDEYTAETTVYSVVFNDYSALTLYSDLLTSTKICRKAAEESGIPGITADKVKKMISIKYSSTGTVLGICATSTDKAIAIRMANLVADTFIGEINNITSSDSVRLLDQATKAELSYNRSLEQLKIRILALCGGVILMCFWIALHEIFTHKIYNLYDAGLEGEIDIIGIVPLFQLKIEGDKG